MVQQQQCVLSVQKAMDSMEAPGCLYESAFTFTASNP